MGASLGVAADFREAMDAGYMPTSAERRAIAGIVEGFMRQYDVKGLSLAIARHGKFVYREGFGLADVFVGKKVTPESLFRIASVSKPLTAVGILTLVDQGRLKLSDRVFGEGGVLGFDYGENYPERVKKITVDDLLTHSAGGWANDRYDPMYRDPTWSAAELITWTLKNQPLDHEPGTTYAYSNFGYCILGRIIEKVTGQPYADWMQQNMLAKCGITDMRIAAGTRSSGAGSEVVYYAKTGDPYAFNISRMDAHGGWIGTPSDLVRFAIRVDGFNTPSLLRPETIRLMTTPGMASPEYARGWMINAEQNWWHNGRLDGTTSILVRTSDNFCWAAFANTSGPDMGHALDQLMWKIKNVVSRWRR
ncbi:serine hydrolase domain-containing protein [Terrimicrobium sacchariphilum]|nr:serine hydrolase [Terrimicrobium sacchariphilum]